MTNLTHISFFLYVYSKSLHVSSTHVLIIRRINCINTTSGMSLYMGDRLVCRLIQLILLMMSTWVLETCSDLE